MFNEIRRMAPEGILGPILGQGGEPAAIVVSRVRGDGE